MEGCKVSLRGLRLFQEFKDILGVPHLGAAMRGPRGRGNVREARVCTGLGRA